MTTLLFSNLSNRRGTWLIPSANDWIQIRNHALQLLIFHVLALQWNFPLFSLSDNTRCTLLLTSSKKKTEENAILQDVDSQHTTGYQSICSNLFFNNTLILAFFDIKQKCVLL